MKKTITATFNSIDMASSSIASIKNRIGSIDSARILYNNNKSDNIIPPVYVSNPLHNNTEGAVPYFSNYTATKNGIQTKSQPNKVTVEIKTRKRQTDEIKNNLLYFGAHDIIVNEK